MLLVHFERSPPQRSPLTLYLRSTSRKPAVLAAAARFSPRHFANQRPLQYLASLRTMACSKSPQLASLLRPVISHPVHLPLRQPLAQQQIRTAVQSANAAKYKRKDTAAKTKKRKGNTSFKQYDLKNAEQFSLCDAMRYRSCAKHNVKTYGG